MRESLTFCGKGVLALAFLSLSASATTVELNDGWLFTQDERLGDSREFSIPDILKYLDGQARELIEVPCASKERVGYEIGVNHPYVKPNSKLDGWTPVRVPHDAAIAYSFNYDLAPFDAYLPGSGVAWYRYNFVAEKDKIVLCQSVDSLATVSRYPSGKVFFDCDGAMAFPMVWLNGRFVGGWPNGYMPWQVNLTPFIQSGTNTLAIRTYRPESYARWHTGIGLTRRCYLTSVPADHLVTDSVFITTPEVSRERAKVCVAYEMSKGGRKTREFTVESPRLWDIEDPYLYTLELEGEAFRYGIRKIEWTVDDGFHLNGRRVQLKGFCFHQDLCSLGSVANRSAIRRRLEKAKALGMNAVRMSHYPHASDWYELCDELGILVMDELTDAWTLPKLYNDYNLLFDDWHERDLRRMIRRHRNHPSIIIWSLGNEIWESRSGKRNWPIYQRNGVEMVRLAHQEDATRPTLTANDNAEVWRSPLAQFTDVFGFNYRPQNYAEFRKLWPGKPVVGSETMCTQASRGEYDFSFVGRKDDKYGLPPVGKTYVNFYSSSYGLHTIMAAEYEWRMQRENPFVAGSFAWTAFDYFGSPAIMISRSLLPRYTDPRRQAQAMADRERYGHVRGGIHSCPTGIFDLAGLMKDEGYLYLSYWRPDVPTCHILPHWNWPDRVGKVTPVHVYSSGDEVELFVNGVSMGRKTRNLGLQRFRFDEVVYQPGAVRAIAYKNGKVWAEETVETTGEPVKLVAIPEQRRLRANGEDVAYVTVKAYDAKGRFCPTAKLPVKATVTGAGEFVAIENGDETDFTWLRDPERRLFNGQLSVLVRAKRHASVSEHPSSIRLHLSSAPSSSEHFEPVDVTIDVCR